MLMSLSVIQVTHSRDRESSRKYAAKNLPSEKDSGSNPYPDVAPTFDHLSDVIPKSHYDDGLALSRALERFKSGHYDKSIEELKAVAESSLFSDYVRYVKALSLMREARFEEALKVIGNAGGPTDKIGWELYWLRLDVRAELKQVDAVRLELSTLLKKHGYDRKRSPITDRHARAAYILGKALLRAGQDTQALKEFEKAVLLHVGTEYDEKIFVEIKKTGKDLETAFTEAQWNTRALKLVENGYAHRATRLYRMLMRKFGGKSNYHERLAYSVFRERRYKLAAAMFEKILKDGNGDSPRLTLLTRLAQSYSRSNQFDDAIRVYGQIMAEYPKTSSAALAKKKIDFLYFDSGQYDKSLKAYKNGSRSQDYHYRFWSHYLSQDHKSALSEIDAWIAITRDKLDLAKLHYWKARVQERLGKKVAAKKNYEKASLVAGGSYYGLLASQRLANGKLHPRTMVDPERLSGLPKLSRNDLPGKRTMIDNPNLIRGAMLYAMGEDLFAFDESRQFLSTHRRPHPQEDIFGLALAGNANAGFGQYRSALAGRVPDCTDESCSWMLGYPLAYRKYVSEFTRHWGIPEGLAFAVMRQESAFKPEAFSYAYANGLMQIIPPTAEEIADKIGEKGFHPARLTDPRVNTLFGTYYLSYLLGLFNNDLVLAMAGYNAGPDAVSRWMDQYGHLETDEFVELIPYSQTQDYVKKVLVNHLIYDRLYFR